LGLCAGALFFSGYFILGALMFQVAYFFDAIDGKLARLLNKSSIHGELYDHITDRIKILVWSSTLAYGVYLYYSNYISLLFILTVFFYAYLSLSIANLWLFYEKFRLSKGITDKSEDIKPTNFFLKICERFHVTPIITDIESSCFIFTIIPILISLQLVSAYIFKWLLILFMILQLSIFIVIFIHVNSKVK
jgi:phosphatidylglycerophosphate synthase